jgi:hypothetical protein
MENSALMKWLVLIAMPTVGLIVLMKNLVNHFVVIINLTKQVPNHVCQNINTAQLT